MENCKTVPKLKKPNCVSIGKFDGVHLGHATILEELVLLSELEECESTVFTFEPFPDEFFLGKELPHISTRGELISSMEEIGVDRLVSVTFDEKFRELSGEEFVKNILLDKLNAKCIVCGSDVHFGKNSSCDAKKLEELSEKYGFKVEIIDKILYNGDEISSKRIIAAIENGNMEDANEMLGYDYFHYGVIVKGEGLGHQFDVPTVNIEPVKGRVIPKTGVYLTIVETDEGEEFHAVTNVGVRPTVSDENKINMESHLIDAPDGVDLYSKRIRVYFLKYVREEIKFDNADLLFDRIKKDITEAKTFFNI